MNKMIFPYCGFESFRKTDGENNENLVPVVGDSRKKVEKQVVEENWGICLKNHSKRIVTVYEDVENSVVYTADSKNCICSWSLVSKKLIFKQKIVNSNGIIIIIQKSQFYVSITSNWQFFCIRSFIDKSTLFECENATHSLVKNSELQALISNDHSFVVIYSCINLILWDLLNKKLESLSIKTKSVAFTPDSTKFVYVAENNFFVFDIKTKTTVSTNLNVLSFSVQQTGGFIAAVCLNIQKIKIFNQRLEEHQVFDVQHPVSHVFISESSEFIATVNDRHVSVFKNSFGYSLYITKAFPFRVLGLYFAKTEKFMFLTLEDHSFSVWGMKNDFVWEIGEGHRGKIFFLEFNKENTNLVTASMDNTIKIWELEKKTVETIEKVNFDHFCIKLLENFIIFSTFSHEIIIWNIKALSIFNTFKGHNQPITVILIENNSNLLFSASLDSSIRIWNINNKDSDVLLDHQKPITSFYYTDPYGKGISAGSKTISIWDLGQKVKIGEISGHSIISKTILEVKPNLLIFGSWEPSMNNWNRIKNNYATLNTFNTITKQLENRIVYKPINGFAVKNNKLLCYSPWNSLYSCWKIKGGFVFSGQKLVSAFYATKNNLLLAGCVENTLHCYDLLKKTEEFQFLGHSSRINSITVTSNNEKAITGSDDSTVIIWNLIEKRLEKVLNGHTDNVTGVSTDDSIIVSVSWDSCIIIWDLLSGNRIKSLLLSKNTFNCISLNREVYVIGSKNKGISFMSQSFQVFNTPKADRIEVACLDVNDLLIAVGCINGTVCYWNKNESKGVKFRDFNSEINNISISYDSKYILYSCAVLVRVWNVIHKKNTICLHGNIGVWINSLNEGLWIACGTFDNNIRVLNLEDSDMNSFCSRKIRILLIMKSKIRFKN